MDTVEAVTVPTIVATNHQATSASTNAINVNQSNNSHPHSNTNPHPHILTAHSSSSGSNSNSNINSSIINSSLIISSNSSSSSSSSSSASSGYGSTSATPTNSYETHAAATTPVAIAEPIIPIATVAAVSPYFSESITTQSLEGQHYAQHHHQQHVNAHQQHQPQSQLHNHQLQQNLQHTQRQQYYSTTYDYQQPQQQQQQQLPQQQQQLTHQQQQQQQQSHNLSLSYNMGSGSPAIDGAASATSSAYQAVGQYKPTDVGVINYERNLTGRSAPLAAATGGALAGSAPTLNYPQPMQQQIPNVSSSKHLTQSQNQQQQFLNATSSSKSRSASSLLGSSLSSSSSTTTKPQAAATPFYAQPLAQQQSNNSSSFYDNLKHKMPLDYHDNFVNFPNAAAYHQQQKYYAAAKSQLKEASTYGSPPGLTGKSLYPNASTYYTGPTGQHASSGYDKYMYPSAYPSLAYETPPDPSYRKSNTTGSMNSHSWPWGIDYASGNSRTIPPPTSHIPTATVAPTHASYLTANTSHLARDPYFMAHDKYGMKYDKYPPPYQQTYVSPPATRHHLWPGTHSALSERLPPPPHTLHSSNYYSANAPTVLNARQSCCTQPYQPQSCYYPPTRLPPHGQPSAMTQTSSYMGTAQPTAHPHQSHLNPLGSSCKYSSVIDYGAANKLKNPNDLYLSTRYDANPPPPHLTHNHGYNYGSTAAAANQLYNPNQIHHGAQPAGPLITHESLVNTPNFTNDLSLTSNTFDSYIHDSPHMNSQGLGMPSEPTAPGYTPVAAKRALLDYRKPIQPQPPPAPIQEECFGQAQNVLATSNISENDYQSTDLLNTPETTSFIEYDTQTQATGYTAEESPATLEQSGKSSEETTKNVSLRDFIANWNDDEDEYAANEEMTFDQSTVINEVLKVTTSIEPETVTVPEQEPVLKAEEVTPQLVEKVSAPEDISKVAEVVNKTTPSAEIDSSQYVNLPDIIIDIEKSNVNTSITTSPNTGDDDAAILLDNFDVEKELDQLQLRKNESDSIIIVKPNHDINPTKDFKNDISSKFKDRDPTKTSQISFDDFSLEQTKAVLPTRPTSTDHVNSAPQSEQLLRDIEGYDSGNSRHSNESSLFEKEYETFINKITTIIPNTKSESEFEENVKEFSKFYKRKRKLRDEEVVSPQCSSEDGKKLKSSDGEKVKNSNFPQVYTKKSRNRRVAVMQRLKQNQMRRRKPSSIYYKLIHSLRRYRRYRSKRVRDYIAELKEKHLPLIKRQSIKNYSIAANRQAAPLFNPQSLKTVVLSVINSEVFRDRFMNIPTVMSLESEDKHICTDPACETCDVIRSLMEADAFDGYIVEQENIVNESAKTDETSQNALMEKQSEDQISHPYEEALNQRETDIEPQEIQLISEQVVEPMIGISNDEMRTKLKTTCSITDGMKEITIIESHVEQISSDQFGSSNILTAISVCNNLESQHVEGYMEVQDLSLPQNKCGLTSVVRNKSQLKCSPTLEKNPNDSEQFPEDPQCRMSNIMETSEINPEIPSVIQTSSVISTDLQSDGSNFKCCKDQEDSTRDYYKMAGRTSDDCKVLDDNAEAGVQYSLPNILSIPEISPEISSVIQKTSIISTEVKNDDSNPNSSGVREDSYQKYPEIAEMGFKMDKSTTNSTTKTSQSEGQDLEIPKFESFEEHQESKDIKHLKLKNPLNIIELDSESDSASESSECDSDCSCSSCSSSESSDEDDKDDQDKSQTSSHRNAEVETENSYSQKKENLKRKTSKVDAEGCPKVIILNKIDYPTKCKADAAKPCIKADSNTVETIVIPSNEHVSALDKNKSDSFNEVLVGSELKDIAMESNDLKLADRNIETIDSDSSSDSSDSGDSSDDDNDLSESEDEVIANAKSPIHNKFEEKYTEAETKKCKSVHSPDDDHLKDFKDLSEKEEDISTNKESSNLTERLQHGAQYGKEITSSHLTQDSPMKVSSIESFPQYPESTKLCSTQSLAGSLNADMDQVAADIRTDDITYIPQDSCLPSIIKNQEHNSLSINMEKVEETSSPCGPLTPKSFHASNEDKEDASMDNPPHGIDKAVASAHHENDDIITMTSKTMDIQNVEPLDYSTLREEKVENIEQIRAHEVKNVTEDTSSTKTSQDELSDSEPVRPRIILSIKRTPEIVDTTTKDATSSVELTTEPKGSYEKYYYTTKFKSSNFPNDLSEESQSSFGTENDESEIEDESEDVVEVPRSGDTHGNVSDDISSKSNCNFSPSTVAPTSHTFAKQNSISSKDFNNLNLSEIDERMGDLFPQTPFGCASPIFDNDEVSRLFTKSDSSVNSAANDSNRSQSLHISEDEDKSSGRDMQEPSVPSFEPSLPSNTEKFLVENCSILQQQDHERTTTRPFIQSATVIMDNPKYPKTLADSHRTSEKFVDVSQNIDEYYTNTWISAPCLRNDRTGDREYCKEGDQSIESNRKLSTLITNLPEDTTSSEILESLRNAKDSILVHTEVQHQQLSKKSVRSAFCNDFEKPLRFGEDIDANSKSFDSNLFNDNENFASEVQGPKQLDDVHERSQLIQDTHSEKYLPVLEDNEVNIQENSSSSTTSNEDYINSKSSNINRCDNDTPEGSMWNRVSVISFSHSNTEASDIQTHEEVNSPQATMDKSLDIFDESINSNLVNSEREEHSDSNIYDDDDSLKNHIKQKSDSDVENDATDNGQFNFHSIFGNLEKLVGVQGANEIGTKKSHWFSASQPEVHHVRDNSAECNEFKTIEVSKISLASASTNKEANHETRVSQCSISHSKSLEESITLAQEREEEKSFQESKPKTSGINSVIVISDSPESPVNDFLLPQDETSTGTQLYESHTSVKNNTESCLVNEAAEDTPVNEISSETLSNQLDMSLLSQIKPDAFECQLIDPLKGTHATSTETTEQDFSSTNALNSDTIEKHEVETEQVLAKISFSQQALSNIPSNSTNGAFDIQQCASPFNPIKARTSVEGEDVRPESFAETFDSKKTISVSSPTKSDTSSEAEVDTLGIVPQSNFISQECLGYLQTGTSPSKEVGSLKELPAERVASQQSPDVLRSLQSKTSENKQVDILEEHIENTITSEQCRNTLRQSQEDTLRSKEDVPECTGSGNNQEVAHHFHKPNEYFENFSKKVEMQENFPEETFINVQSPSNLNLRKIDTLRTMKHAPKVICTGDNQDIAHSLNRPNNFENFNNEVEAQETCSEKDSLNPMKEEDVPKENCTGNNKEVAHNLHRPNECFEDLNEEFEAQEKVPKEIIIPQQSPTTLSPREEDSLRLEEELLEENCTVDSEEVAHNLYRPNEYFQDFNKEVETQEIFSEETLISEQSPTTLSPREEGSLRSEEDVSDENCTHDNEEVAHNLHMPKEYVEDFNKEVERQEKLSVETLIPEQFPNTLSPREETSLRSEEDVSEENCTADNEEVAHNLHRPNEYFEDFNKEMETQEKLSVETLIPEQFLNTLSPRGEDTIRSEDDVAEYNCTGVNREIAHNLHRPNNKYEEKVEKQEELPEETFIPEQSSNSLSPRGEDTLRSKEDVPEDNCTDINKEVAHNFHRPNNYLEENVETQEELPEEALIPKQSSNTLSPRGEDTLRSKEDVAKDNCTGDSQEILHTLHRPNENVEDFNKEVETREELPEETFIPKHSPTTLNPMEEDSLRSEKDVPEDNCTGDNHEVAHNLHKANNNFAEKVETHEELSEETLIRNQCRTPLSTREEDTLVAKTHVLAETLSKTNEYFEDFRNESIEELPIYPRFGRFKNYRSRNLENYNTENKSSENSVNLGNSMSASTKKENQFNLQSVQHGDQTSGCRRLVEEHVTDSLERCCEKPTDELPNVCSPKYESVVVNAIESAEMEDHNMCPASTYVSVQSELSAVMGLVTPQLEIAESLSSDALQSTVRITTSPTESQREDKRLSTCTEPQREDARLSTNLETLTEDTALDALERISPVDSLKCETIPSQDNSTVSTVLTEEIINITNTQDKTNTTDDMSMDFLGFKNQSSFEDESGDFHGFEDRHEEERIRREIENLNDDSAANDAFPYLGLDAKTSSHSSSMSSDLNELEALEKELSQHRLIRDLNGQDETDEDAETEQHLVSVANVSISTNDIEHIKKMLESDEEHADNDEYKDNTHKDDRKSKLIALEENISLSNAFEIPKLSDLCRAALNSSLIVNNLTTVQSSEEEENPHRNTTPLANALVIEREFSVEEALAEMYRQAGVLLSDPEDTDNDKSITNEEAQDVLLINLQEILNSDNDNVFVLQCDMNVNVHDTNNENILDDDKQNGHDSENGSGSANANDTTERVNTLQLIGILNTDLENPEIHIISSDSESEVIILSDCDTDVEFHSEPFSPPAPPSTIRTATTTTTGFMSTREYIPFIDDLETNDDSQSDLSTIHHEEIVPDNLNKFLKEEFYRYLHEKYAQKKLSKYYHANRVLRKYKKRYSNKFRQ